MDYKEIVNEVATIIGGAFYENITPYALSAMLIVLAMLIVTLLFKSIWNKLTKR